MLTPVRECVVGSGTDRKGFSSEPRATDTGREVEQRLQQGAVPGALWRPKKEPKPAVVDLCGRLHEDQIEFGGELLALR